MNVKIMCNGKIQEVDTKYYLCAILLKNIQVSTPGKIIKKIQ